VAGLDELAVTPAARDALARLRVVAGGVDGPMERHCLRVRRVAAELARRRGWEVDGEVLTVAAILHDIGIYPGASRGGVYTADGAALAREMLGADLLARVGGGARGARSWRVKGAWGAGARSWRVKGAGARS
jgi:putative nucleotidyltransferase with HDIG domain